MVFKIIKYIRFGTIFFGIILPIVIILGVIIYTPIRLAISNKNLIYLIAICSLYGTGLCIWFELTITGLKHNSKLSFESARIIMLLYIPSILSLVGIKGLKIIFNNEFKEKFCKKISSKGLNQGAQLPNLEGQFTESNQETNNQETNKKTSKVKEITEVGDSNLIHEIIEVDDIINSELVLKTYLDSRTKRNNKI